MALDFQLVCFDSFGAKSACTLVKTPDITILLEPGVAVMHHSFPGTIKQKNEWHHNGLLAIKDAIKKSDVLISSHYHLDHFIDTDFELFRNKLLFMKNPNEYINDNQRNRAELFYQHLYPYYNNYNIYDNKNIVLQYNNPLEDIPLACNMDYGDYNQRKKQLMEKGKRWFDRRVKNWNKKENINDIHTENINVYFPENKTFIFGQTTITCSKPLFHGIEYARVGWVFSTLIECNGKKILHSSDLCGPMIEDYAEMIINENPDILILDGPMTYMYGFMLTTINLKRTIDNLIRIIKESDIELIIYDHHLCRDKRYKQRTKPVWHTAIEYGKTLVTASEYLGKTPAVLEN
jgi:uncharacterized protein